MNTTALDDTGDLRAACTAAQLQAERHFGDAPPPPWEPAVPAAAALARHWRWAGLGGLAVAAALIAWSIGGRSAEAAAAPAPVAAWEHESGVDEVDDADPPEPRGAAQAVLPVALAVSHSGRFWRVEAQGASRLDAARRLAELSGSALHGSIELLAQARPLDLRWQGRTLAQAWEQVLGQDLNYALQCRRDRCEAWIVAAAPPGGSSALPLSAFEGAAAAGVPAMDVDDVPESRETNPTGDAGASHH